MAARGPQPQRRDPQRTVPPPPDSAGQRAVTRGIRGMGPQPKSAPKPGGYHWPTGGGSPVAKARVAMQVERALTTPNRARQAARPLLNMNARPKAPSSTAGRTRYTSGVAQVRAGALAPEALGNANALYNQQPAKRGTPPRPRKRKRV